MVARLKEFRINHLFGLYSHIIPINLDERITIIIGPNGRGKTICLKFIEALFRKRFFYFSEIPFSSAEFEFDNGDLLKLECADDRDTSLLDRTPSRSIHYTLHSDGKEDVLWMPERVLAREARRFIPPNWRQANYDLWIDENDGEELTTEEIIARLRIPSKLASSLRQDMPGPLNELIKAVDCHLIETQRLVALPPETDVREFRHFYERERVRTPRSQLAIQQKAEKLKAILKETLAHYANRSQSLDRTFPLRVFEAQGSPTLSEDELRRALETLDQRREALMTSGILDTDYRPVRLRAGAINPGVSMALEIYVTDTSSKLDVFDDIRSKIDLFKELISKRFIDKTLHIDLESGFKITSRNGSDVPLDKLSSGEQHQLILIFDLLFEVTRNSLILIDEPELSLHVAWQKAFIESLSRIISLNAFNVILATHFPAMVAMHFVLAVDLGPVAA